MSPSTSPDGRAGGGPTRDGGNGGTHEIGSSCTFGRSIDYFDDRPRCDATVENEIRSRRSPGEQPTELRQTYHLLRKGKESIQQHGQPTNTLYGYEDVQDLLPSFVGSNQFSFGIYDTYGQGLNEYEHSLYPSPLSRYFPLHVPQFEQQISARCK